MENIKSIIKYDSAYELLDECMDAEAFDTMSEDMKLYFMNFEDFEYYDYFLINGQYILVSEGVCNIGGDVIGRYENAQEFFDCLVRCYHEDND